MQAFQVKVMRAHTGYILRWRLLRADPPAKGHRRGERDQAQRQRAAPPRGFGGWRDAANEAITHARQRLDVPRGFAHIIQRDAQLAHRHVEAVVEVYDARRPQHLHELLACNHLTRVVEQFSEYSQGLWGQTRRVAFPGNLPRDPVHLPAIELQIVFGRHALG
jgi:hypothetical protein